MVSINDLPPELLAHIFSFCIKLQGYRRFLKNIPLVCKRWNEVHLIPSLWENVSTPLHADGKEWSWEEMKKLGEKGLLSSARYLNLYRCPYDENEMTQFIRYFHNLEALLVMCTFMPRAAMEVLEEQCPNIRSLNLTPSDQQLEDVFTPFLKVRGRNIKTLEIEIVPSFREKNWVSTIAESCASLEGASFTECNESYFSSSSLHFPIFQLIVGCPKIRKFEIYGFKFASEVRDHNGFSVIEDFDAYQTDFSGVELYSILKNSRVLRAINIVDCENVTWSRISRIASEGLRWFGIIDRNLDRHPLKFLKEVAARWKHSLRGLRIRDTQSDLTGVLEAYLQENPEPKLRGLDVSGRFNLSTEVLDQLKTACKDLEVYF